VGYRKNPLIRAVPYRYIPTSLTGGFFTEVASPTSPSHYADRDDFSFPIFGAGIGGLPSAGGRAIPSRRRHALHANVHISWGSCARINVTTPFQNHGGKRLLGMAETRFPKTWLGHIWKLFPNRLIGERTTNPPEHEDDRPRGAAQMPLISTEPHCTVVLFAPDRGGLCAVPILKIRERDTGKRVWAPTGAASSPHQILKIRERDTGKQVWARQGRPLRRPHIENIRA
jgi:hypothetical protein